MRDRVEAKEREDNEGDDGFDLGEDQKFNAKYVSSDKVEEEDDDEDFEVDEDEEGNGRGTQRFSAGGEQGDAEQGY